MDQLGQCPRIAEMNYLAEKPAAWECAHLIRGFDGVDAEKISASAKSYGTGHEADANLAINKVSWTVAAAAGTEAKKVFPNTASIEEAVDLLWDRATFKTCRVYEDDPVTAWKAHRENSAQKLRFLNEEQFTALLQLLG